MENEKVGRNKKEKKKKIVPRREGNPSYNEGFLILDKVTRRKYIKSGLYMFGD